MKPEPGYNLSNDLNKILNQIGLNKILIQIGSDEIPIRINPDKILIRIILIFAKIEVIDRSEWIATWP